MKEIKKLLEEVRIIDSEFKPLRDKDKFNIFTILRKSSDEVHLHSRFIYELLNPKGSHNMKDAFLKLWLKTLEIQNFKLEGIKVFREKHNIDLLITNKYKKAIVIENKIWATDQPEQLQRYYDKMRDTGFSVMNVFYLSPDGRLPEEQSVGSLPEKLLQTISYSDEVLKWLEECRKVNNLTKSVLETIQQYLKLIQKMTGKSNNTKENIAYYNLIGKENNAFQAIRVIQNWSHIRWHTEWDFWCELENIINVKYDCTNIEKYHNKRITDTVHNSKKRKLNNWYGLTFKLFDYKDLTLGIRIRRNSFHSKNIGYYLVIIEENEIIKIKKKSTSITIVEKLEGLDENTAKGNYLVSKSFPINFDNFKNETTLKLVNPTTRQKVITDFFEEIEGFIENIKMKLDIE